MMAPNPHWWAQEAEKFTYSSRKARFNWQLHFLSLACLFVDTMIRHNSKLPGPFFLLAIFFWICQFPGILELGNHSNQRLETRFNHLTVFRGTDVLEHEDMRDIISLEPVFNARSGKLKYHIASFPTGHQIKIFANLDRHDELIAKLQSYLPSAS